MPNLYTLTACRGILRNPAVAALSRARLEEGARHEAISAFLSTAEAVGLSGNIVRAVIAYALIHEETLVAKSMERAGTIGDGLRQAFLRDMQALAPLFADSAERSLAEGLLDNYQPTLRTTSRPLRGLLRSLRTTADPEELMRLFLSFYEKHGYGDLALCRAFQWDGLCLLGIPDFDGGSFEDIIGYERQKKQLRQNTEAFLQDKSANNALLIGARGTGKSSSIKALASAYEDSGLKLVEIRKENLNTLPHLLKTLGTFPRRHFIVFLDDLSFESSDDGYKRLKSAMEGGLAEKPKNVLLYATSNRRHLIKETWTDREGAGDEIYRNDSMNEMVSLSDRFGLVLTFLSPNQEQYLTIVAHYLKKAGISLPEEELRLLGHRWELEHSGRTGRTAEQLAAWYLSRPL